MLYVKNVPNLERAARVVIGLAGLDYATLNWGVSPAGVGLGLSGAVLALTGLVGFCPMCAMAGRTLDKGR